jgi:pimeloyl-ACP methyl ester carboxylesterase
MASFIQDLADLVEQLGLAPVTLIGHSRGGRVVLRYAGTYPETVSKVVAIEGLGPTVALAEDTPAATIADRLRAYTKIERQAVAKPRKPYPSLDACIQRMRQAHSGFSEERIRHLTEHGVIRDSDGQYRWKFDPVSPTAMPYDMSGDEIRALWGRIDCPVLHICGSESGRVSPAEDGKIKFFKNAKAITIQGASHWVHHDQFEPFIKVVGEFLGPEQ